MTHKHATDFTTGSIPRHLLNFSTPMLLGNLLQALYNTVDSIWVGHSVGPEGLGAVSVSFPIIFILISLIMGIAMATTVLVSQASGAKKTDLVKRIIGNSLTVLFIAAVLATAAGLLFADALLKLIRTPVEIYDQASSYLTVFLSGLVFMFLYNSAGAILRGLGDSKTPLIYLVYATIINVLLDPILILGLGPFPKMGVAGAALATVIAQGISAFLILRRLQHLGLISFNLKDYAIDKKLTITTFKIGLPVGIQQSVVSVGMLAMTALINSFGGIAAAAFGAASRLDQFSFMPAMSISLSVSSLVGQNLGAGKEERVKTIVFWAILLSGSITAVVAILVELFPAALIRLFTTDTSVLAEGARYLRIVALSYVPFAVMFALGGVMQGAGDTIPQMFFTIINLWVVRIPLGWYLAYKLNWGLTGIWWSIALGPVVGLLLGWTYYLTGRWKNKVAIKAEATKLDLQEA